MKSSKDRIGAVLLQSYSTSAPHCAGYLIVYIFGGAAWRALLSHSHPRITLHSTSARDPLLLLPQMESTLLGQNLQSIVEVAALGSW